MEKEGGRRQSREESGVGERERDDQSTNPTNHALNHGGSVIQRITISVRLS